jgi:hypothetical protein
MGGVSTIRYLPAFSTRNDELRLAFVKVEAELPKTVTVNEDAPPKNLPTFVLAALCPRLRNGLIQA